jgi:hypothetical protein
MKIWISDEKAASHRLVRFHCEEHSGYYYLGDLNDDEIKLFFTEVQPDMSEEVQNKNLQRITYFGYLHLFIINKR